MKKICLKEFIPEKVICKNDINKSYDLKIIDDEIYLTLTYLVDSYNHLGLCGKRCFTLLLPKYVRKNQETFEVLGLLQAEMGKKNDGKIVFCNHEYKLINKVIKWFDKELSFSKDKWRWYIKVNINEPLDENYKKEVEEKVISHWIKRTGISLEQSYNKKVSYIKNTSNKILDFYDCGTLIIEHSSNLFSQFIKTFVKKTTLNILTYEENEIRGFMKGIIAGESCVEIDEYAKKFRVHISVKDKNEKLIYHNCLNKLGINSKIYGGDKLVISRKENNLQLLKRNLMTLSPQKYSKFLRMMNFYGLEDWRNNLQKPHNKIPQWKIDEILRLHDEHPIWPAWKIAELVGVSSIKVQRVRKEESLKDQIL